MSLESRVAKLEAQNRFLRVVVVVGLLLAGLPWAMGAFYDGYPAHTSSKVVSTSALYLIDDDGVRRASFEIVKKTGAAVLMMGGNPEEATPENPKGIIIAAGRQTRFIGVTEGYIRASENGKVWTTKDLNGSPKSNDTESPPVPTGRLPSAVGADTPKKPSQDDVETRARLENEQQEHDAAIAGISAALKTFEADVAKNRELLKPIESRIFRNTLKNDKSLRNAIEKDKARAQEYKDAIAAGEKRIAELKAKLTKEQKAIGDNSKQP